MEKPKVEKKIIPKKDVIIEKPKDLPKEEPKEEPKPETPEPGGVAGGVVGGVQGGTVGGTVGGVIGGTVGGQLGGTLGGTGNGVVPFGEGMTRPSPLGGDEIQYTREAREAHISGVMIVKCTIQTDGSVTNCRVIKGVPMMDAAVLAALARHHGSPVTFQGHPVAVDYTYTIKLKMPD